MPAQSVFTFLYDTRFVATRTTRRDFSRVGYVRSVASIDDERAGDEKMASGLGSRDVTSGVERLRRTLVTHLSDFVSSQRWCIIIDNV